MKTIVSNDCITVFPSEESTIILLPGIPVEFEDSQADIMLTQPTVTDVTPPAAPAPATQTPASAPVATDPSV